MDGCREDVMGNDSIKVPSLREDQVPAVEGFEEHNQS